MKRLNVALKIISFVFVAAAFSFSAKAQDSKVLGGLGLNYTSDIGSVGITAKGVYMIDENWEGSAGFTYLFENNYTNWSMLDLDGHYVFSSDDKKAFYGLAGLNFTFWKFDYSYSYGYYIDDYSINGTEVGINLGAGGRFKITDDLSVFGEAKYTFGGFNFLTLGAGVLYHF